MKKCNGILRHATAVLVTSLASMPAVSDTESPFQIRNFEKATDTAPQYYGGMCGGAWGTNREGYCGGMMGGMMMGGAMPPSYDPAQLPEASSDSAKLVTKFCTQCHGLPAPEQHSAEGWPVTVTRMNTRMQWMARNRSPMNIVAPTEAELASITAYLKKHAHKAEK